MALTLTELKQVIKEELTRVLEEELSDAPPDVASRLAAVHAGGKKKTESEMISHLKEKGYSEEQAKKIAANAMKIRDEYNKMPDKFKSRRRS